MLANALLGLFGGPRFRSHQENGEAGHFPVSPPYQSLLSWRPKGYLNPCRPRERHPARLIISSLLLNVTGEFGAGGQSSLARHNQCTIAVFIGLGSVFDPPAKRFLKVADELVGVKQKKVCCRYCLSA